MSGNLDFVIGKPTVNFSLSPLKSDFWDNLIVMEQVVGTLVKYGQFGSYEPFLANKWEASLDERRWVFYFRPSLFDERGESIDAKKFSSSFRTLLKVYSASYEPPVFKDLEGWEDFRDNKADKLGVTALDSHSLEFRFKVRPSGLLEFLSMPYYGYYNQKDFDSTGKWKDELQITSTGAYRVAEAKSDYIILTARNDWPTLGPDSPNRVRIFSSAVDDLKFDKAVATIVSTKGAIEVNPRGFTSIDSTPTLLTGFIISPFLEPFNDRQARLAFRTVIRDCVKKMKSSRGISRFSKHIYPTTDDFSVEISEFDDAIRVLRAVGPMNIKVFQYSTNNEDLWETNLILNSIGEKIGWTFEIETPEKIGPSWQKKATSNRVYPIRKAVVDVGGHPENWVIEMMFCSTLGVSFPDPSGEVCKLVADYQSNKSFDRVDYQMRLFDAIEREASVVPLFHSGFTWLVSDRVSLEDLSPTMNVPRFDQIGVR